MTPLPRHPREPLADVDCLQSFETRRIAGHGRTLQGGAVCPCHLFQFEGAALPYTVLVGIGKAAAIEKHRGDTGRAGTGERGLHMGRIGQPHGPNFTVAPRLTDDPLAGVITVQAIAQVFDELTFRSIAPAAVLVNDDVASGHEVARHPGTALWRRILGSKFRTARDTLPVRS